MLAHLGEHLAEVRVRELVQRRFHNKFEFAPEALERGFRGAFGDGVVIAWPGQTSAQAGGERAGKRIRLKEEDVLSVRGLPFVNTLPSASARAFAVSLRCSVAASAAAISASSRSKSRRISNAGWFSRMVFDALA